MDTETTISTPAVKTYACKDCGRIFKNAGGVNLHARKAHPAVDSAKSAASPITTSTVSQSERPAQRPVAAFPEEVTFYCPRPLYQTVVVIPEQWYNVEGPAGSKQEKTEGKLAEFDNGKFVTDDPEIIDYLENVNHRCEYHTGKRRGGYSDFQFPIHSARKIA